MSFRKIVIISILMISVLLVFTGCEQEDNEALLQNKFISEMEYIENYSLNIIKKVVNDDYIENNELNWSYIQNDFTFLEKSSNQIVIDLAALGIRNENILELENRISLVSDSISNKSYENLILSLSNIYNLVPDYLNEKSNNHNYNQIKLIKNYIVSSLVNAYINNFDNSVLYINEAQQLFQELSKDETYLELNAYKVNRCYVAIEEMKVGVENGNLDRTKKNFLILLELF